MEKLKRLSIRVSGEELEELDKALEVMGYGGRAEWFRQKRREIVKEAEKKLKQSGKSL